MKETILFATTEENPERWTTELRRHAPQLDLRIWPDVGQVEDIEYAIVARPPAGELARYPNLKAILSMWAGVEDLLSDPQLEHLPIVRMTEPGLTDGIVVYVAHHVIGFHMHVSHYRQRSWEHPFHSNYKAPRDTCVGILGLGVLGKACAIALDQLGFKVIGYSARRKQVPNVRSYAGPDELGEFLGQTDILVSILPRTPQTDNFVDRETLAQLPPGARIINVGRGESIDDDALLEAIQSGHLAGAVLDVFRTEPLPDDHPFWDEPNIKVTPHCASKPDPTTASAVILEKMEKLKRGEPVEGIVDRNRYY